MALGAPQVVRSLRRRRGRVKSRNSDTLVVSRRHHTSLQVCNASQRAFLNAAHVRSRGAEDVGVQGYPPLVCCGQNPVQDVPGRLLRKGREIKRCTQNFSTKNR